MYRYRAKTRALLEWRKDWLTQTNQILSLGDAARRDELLQEKVAELKSQIQNRIEENDLLRFYQEAIADEPGDDQLKLPSATPGPVEPGADAAPIALVPAIEITPRPANQPTSPLLAQVYDVMRDHRQNLRDWDIRFRDLHQLMHLFRAVWGVSTESVKTFLKENLESVQEELKVFKRKRNLVAGSLIALGSSIGPMLFKAYQNDIINLIKKLAGSSV
jgi:hypothetical protein